MRLEDKVREFEAAYGQVQPVWEERQRRWQPWVRLFLKSYFLTGHGPKKVEGPALIVFDRHDFSPDPIFIVRQDGFRTMVAKEGNALLSRMAHEFGGIIVNEDKTRKAALFLKAQLNFHLNQGHVIGLFPYTDVNGADLQYGIVRSTMVWERESGIPVKYISAAVRYHNMLPFVDKVWHMPGRLSNWPWPLVTHAKLFISGEPLYSRGLFPNSEGAKGLVSKLVAESASLPGHYGRRGILQAFYTCARQFFSG